MQCRRDRVHDSKSRGKNVDARLKGFKLVLSLRKLTNHKNRQQYKATNKMAKASSKATRLIRAVHDDETVRVYQAYNKEIAEMAVATQSFTAAMESGLWSKKRMTWIKPSKVWMAYRCGWANKESKQSRVLAIDLDRQKFVEILSRATLAHGNSNANCRNSSVIVQWDPERILCTTSIDRTTALCNARSIQIGLRPPANECLLDANMIKRITDVTGDFIAAEKALKEGKLDDAVAALWPGSQTESLLIVTRQIEEELNMTKASTREGNSAIVVLGCTTNPPHQGHFYCLKEASAKASELGYNVLFSTIAVAPYGYVKHKMTKINDLLLLDDNSRLSILRSLASNDESFNFREPDRTYGSAMECGRSLRPKSDVTVIVVVGGDRFRWTKKCHPDLVTLCCARSQEQFLKLQSDLAIDINRGLVENPGQWQMMSYVGPPISSTLVRAILQDPGMTNGQKKRELSDLGYPDEAVHELLEASLTNSS